MAPAQNAAQAKRGTTLRIESKMVPPAGSLKGGGYTHTAVSISSTKYSDISPRGAFTPAKEPIDELENDISDMAGCTILYSISRISNQQSASAISISINIRLGQATGTLLTFLRQLFFRFAQLLTRNDTNDHLILGFNFNQRRPFLLAARFQFGFGFDGIFFFFTSRGTNSSRMVISWKTCRRTHWPAQLAGGFTTTVSETPQSTSPTPASTTDATGGQPTASIPSSTTNVGPTTPVGWAAASATNVSTNPAQGASLSSTGHAFFGNHPAVIFVFLVSGIVITGLVALALFCCRRGWGQTQPHRRRLEDISPPLLQNPSTMRTSSLIFINVLLNLSGDSLPTAHSDVDTSLPPPVMQRERCKSSHRVPVRYTSLGSSNTPISERSAATSYALAFKVVSRQEQSKYTPGGSQASIADVFAITLPTLRVNIQLRRGDGI
ncbi:hypothetical protein V8E52_001287 [Russula decolorans]